MAEEDDDQLHCRIVAVVVALGSGCKVVGKVAPFDLASHICHNDLAGPVVAMALAAVAGVEGNNTLVVVADNMAVAGAAQVVER